MQRSMLAGLSRAAVIDTACELFAERGYRGTSMKDVAETLGVRASSLYNHVTSSCGRPPSPWCWTSCATRPR
jgi:AcrR family transcriptional regulator